MWHDRDWGAWDWTAMTLMMLLFRGGLIALVVFLARAGGRNSHDSRTTATPDEVLAQRFARGEIDEDEFIRSRQVLHDTGPTA
jgi:putative membrane protein